MLALGFKGADPIFPKIENRLISNDLLKQSIQKEEIKSETTIRNVFKKAFESVALNISSLIISAKYLHGMQNPKAQHS